MGLVLEAVTFVPAAGDGGGYLDEQTSDLSDRCDAVPTENWLLRPGSIATYLNDAPASYLYKLAALEVTRRQPHG